MTSQPSKEQKGVDHPEWDYVKDKAKQWFGMELMEDNFEHCLELVRSIEYNKKGKKRTRQQIRNLVRGM